MQTTGENERLRSDCREIFAAALQAARADSAVERTLGLEGGSLTVAGEPYETTPGGSVFVVGFGKASAYMAAAAGRKLGGRLAGGLVSTKYGHGCGSGQVRVVEAGHPVPDGAGMKAAREIMALAHGAGEGDLILCLISGGGSALLPLPADGITLDEKMAATELLLRCGAGIREVNALRKHISAIKGGQLARAAHPARVLNLIVSDVIGDPLETIASGPTVPDATTFEDCLAIVRRRDLASALPQAVMDRLEAGARGEVEETPKPGDAVFGRVRSCIIASNAVALRAAERHAVELGYNARVVSDTVEGEAREVAAKLVRLAKDVAAGREGPARPACLLVGGETTVTVHGKGRGGRNQELVLAAALELDEMPGVVLLGAGTDGTDGPTDAAGAFADGKTAGRARALGIDGRAFLEENDSYRFFHSLGDLHLTGPTGTNVMDITVFLVV